MASFFDVSAYLKKCKRLKESNSKMWVVVCLTLITYLRKLMELRKCEGFILRYRLHRLNKGLPWEFFPEGTLSESVILIK